jgi:hypothetical protein
MNEQQEREAFFKYLINDDQVICTPAALHHILQSNPSEWQAWQARAKFEADRAQRQAGQEPVAWMRVKPSAMPDWDEYDFSANEQEGFDVALYAAPQPAQADKDAEIAALRKDAERYRWLMNNCGFGMNRNGVHELTTVFYENQPDNIGDLDAAIDAALQAQAVQP